MAKDQKTSSEFGYAFTVRHDVDPMELLDRASLGLHHHMSPADEEESETEPKA